MRSRRAGHDTVLRLIEQAYAAAEAPHLWESFLLSLAESVNGRGAVLLGHDLMASGAITVGVRLDVAGVGRYDRHFNQCDPWAAGARAFGPGVVATDAMLISKDDLRRTEYFNDFAVRFDAARLLTVVLEQRRSASSVLTVLRAEHDAPFETDDRRVVASVVPHVQRALQIHERIGEARHERAVAIEALDAAPCAVFLVNADARVVVANHRGRVMLAANDGLSTDQSRLSSMNPRETARLRDLCAAVSVMPLHPGSMMMLTGRTSERPPLQVMVVPATSAPPQGPRDPRVTAVVFVSDPAEARGPSETLLQATFGLTPAEANVAARIAVGHGLAEIATERGSALETVRRQSKQILAKTGARHRADLIRLLLALPLAMRSPADPTRLRTPPG